MKFFQAQHHTFKLGFSTHYKLFKLIGYNYPIYNINKAGAFALTLNFYRLTKIRPAYGYFNKKNIEFPPDDQDGIWNINLDEGNVKLIISLAQLRKILITDSMKDSVHKINHIDINPSGTRFMFLHRWNSQRGRYMRLITANPDGSEIFILNGYIMTSHCCWFDDHTILSYCYIEGRGNGYFKFEDKTKNVYFFSKKMPKIDGHLSISPNRKYLITDTYPDQSRMSYLHLYDFDNDTLHKLARFYQPFRYKDEIRIDLHPKWTPCSNKVYIESGHNKKRMLFEVNIKKLII